MSSRYGYCTTKSLHGIFRSFSSNLWDNVQAEVTSNDSTPWQMENAFNYETDEYWISGLGDENWLKMCFKHHYVKSFGFELGTSNEGRTIKGFAFSTSNDIHSQKWEHKKEFNYSFSIDAIHYFDYSSPPRRCFKLDCLANNADDSKRFDLRYIEIFGEIHNKISQFNQGTCHTFFNHFRISFLINLICLYDSSE